MTTENEMKRIIRSKAVSENTVSEIVDCLAFDVLNVVWNVSNGSGDEDHKLGIKVQTSDVYSTDDNDWADMVPESGALNDVGGKGGTNEWPVTQSARFREMSQYVRVVLTIAGGGTWTTSVSGAAKAGN